MGNKKLYQREIILARQELRDGKIIHAFETLGSILEHMEKI